MGYVIVSHIHANVVTTKKKKGSGFSAEISHNLFSNLAISQGFTENLRVDLEKDVVRSLEEEGIVVDSTDPSYQLLSLLAQRLQSNFELGSSKEMRCKQVRFRTYLTNMTFVKFILFSFGPLQYIGEAFETYLRPLLNTWREAPGNKEAYFSGNKVCFLTLVSLITLLAFV